MISTLRSLSRVILKKQKSAMPNDVLKTACLQHIVRRCGLLRSKRMGVRPPHGLTPDGHLRGLPQSFTRSQKERPLSESIVIPTVRALVAIILHHDDEFATPVFSHSSANFRRKASAGTGTPDFNS